MMELHKSKKIALTVSNLDVLSMMIGGEPRCAMWDFNDGVCALKCCQTKLVKGLFDALHGKHLQVIRSNFYKIRGQKQ
jgi:hypothetical protein